MDEGLFQTEQDCCQTSLKCKVEIEQWQFVTDQLWTAPNESVRLDLAKTVWWRFTLWKTREVV